MGTEKAFRSLQVLGCFRGGQEFRTLISGEHITELDQSEGLSPPGIIFLPQRHHRCGFGAADEKWENDVGINDDHAILFFIVFPFSFFGCLGWGGGGGGPAVGFWGGWFGGVRAALFSFYLLRWCVCFFFFFFWFWVFWFFLQLFI